MSLGDVPYAHGEFSHSATKPQPPGAISHPAPLLSSTVSERPFDEACLIPAVRGIGVQDGDCRTTRVLRAGATDRVIRGAWFVLASAVAIGATMSITLVAFSLTSPIGRFPASSSRVLTAAVAQKGNGAPAVVNAISRLRLSRRDDSICRAIERLKVRPTCASQLLHELLLFGPSFDVKDPQTVASYRAVDLILDSSVGKRYFDNKPTLIPTLYGVSSRELVRRDFRWQSEREAHPGQILAVFAEAGIPLSTRLAIETSPHTVEDLLNDAMASFDTTASEIEWTVTALAFYLGPQRRREWSDKFGRTFSFDDAAQELIRRPFMRRGVACRGIHGLQALTIIVRVDKDYTLLSQSVRLRAMDYLQHQLEHLRKTQDVNGSWPPDWYLVRNEREEHREPTQSELIERTTVTAHHLEWLLKFPTDHPISDPALARAVSWLQNRLSSAPQVLLKEQYCPYSHAAHVLKIVCGPDCNSP